MSRRCGRAWQVLASETWSPRRTPAAWSQREGASTIPIEAACWNRDCHSVAGDVSTAAISASSRNAVARELADTDMAAAHGNPTVRRHSTASATGRSRTARAMRSTGSARSGSTLSWPRWKSCSRRWGRCCCCALRWPRSKSIATTRDGVYVDRPPLEEDGMLGASQHQRVTDQPAHTELGVAGGIGSPLPTEVLDRRPDDNDFAPRPTGHEEVRAGGFDGGSSSSATCFGFPPSQTEPRARFCSMAGFALLAAGSDSRLRVRFAPGC